MDVAEQGGVSARHEADPSPGVNDVALMGKLSAIAQERELPSGDLIVTFRLVVERPPPKRGAPDRERRTTQDTLDCVVWAAGLRRRALGCVAGDVLEVHGALHRRFWRAGPAVASRYEVQVATLRRAPRPAVHRPA